MEEMKGILFAGLCCLDIISVCNDYPREDSDQRVLNQRWHRGGNAANNCTAFAKLREWFAAANAHPCPVFVEYFGTFGNDCSANFLLADFPKYDISVKKVDTSANCETPCSVAIINSRNGSRTILHSNKNFEEPRIESFTKLDLANYCWIHFEGRNVTQVKNMIRYVREIRCEAKNMQRKIGISVELEKPRESLKEFFEEDIDYLFVGKEFANYCGFTDIDDAIDKISLKVRENTTVVCLWGENGVKASKKTSANKQLVCSSKIFVPKNGLVDTLGAGDTCVAAILFAVIVLCLDLQQSLEFGCQVAGAKCGISGFDSLHQFKDLI